MPRGEPRTAPDELTVITLCGSLRFREEFERLDAELSLAGHVVLTPAALDPSREVSEEELARLGRVHLQKIAMSDEVLVVNVGGYVGESTRREIEHARLRGVTVRFLVSHANERHLARAVTRLGGASESSVHQRRGARVPAHLIGRCVRAWAMCETPSIS